MMHPPSVPWYQHRHTTSVRFLKWSFLVIINVIKGRKRLCKKANSSFRLFLSCLHLYREAGSTSEKSLHPRVEPPFSPGKHNCIETEERGRDRGGDVSSVLLSPWWKFPLHTQKGGTWGWDAAEDDLVVFSTFCLITFCLAEFVGT